MILGMQQRDIFDWSRKDKQTYVITTEELAVNVVSLSTDLKYPTPIGAKYFSIEMYIF